MARKKKSQTKPETSLIHQRTSDLSPLRRRACTGESAQTVKAYLDAGGSPVAPVELTGTGCVLQVQPLHSMAMLNAHPHTELPESVRLLVAAGADINAKAAGPGDNDNTALMYAGQLTCCTVVADVLLQAGADPCVQSTGRCLTALHLAAAVGLADCCELLLRQADTLLETRDSNGCTALMHAAQSGNLDNVKLLLQHGADVNAVNLVAVSSSSRVPASVVAALLEAGADVNAVDNNRLSALAAAVDLNRADVVQLFLDHGADVSITDNNGQTALFRAARNGHVSLMELLVQSGLDVSTADNTGITSLMIAAVNGQKLAAEWLLHHGAAVDAADQKSYTALQDVSECSSSDDATMIELLLANGADVHKCSNDGSSALDGAAHSGNIQCAKVLIAAGLDVNRTNSSGYSPLQTAVLNNHTEIVQLLLKHGGTAELNSVVPVQCSEHGCETATALMTCAEPDLVKLLLAAGADVHVTNDAGNTALHIAAKHKWSASMLCLLIKAGANLHALNNEGKTAEQIAHECGHTLLEQLLNRAARDD
eukprot:20348-Heterococcus_DN1.PRE.1